MTADEEGDVNILTQNHSVLGRQNNATPSDSHMTEFKLPTLPSTFQTSTECQEHKTELRNSSRDVH